MNPNFGLARLVRCVYSLNQLSARCAPTVLSACPALVVNNAAPGVQAIAEGIAASYQAAEGPNEPYLAFYRRNKEALHESGLRLIVTSCCTFAIQCKYKVC